jgi:hypothetical protein
MRRLSIKKSLWMKFVTGRSLEQQLGEECLRLVDHGILQHLIELGVKRRVGRGGVDAAQIEPLTGEVLHEGLAAFVGEQAFHLRFQCFGLVELFRGGEAHELVIRQSRPEEIREA